MHDNNTFRVAQEGCAHMTILKTVVSEEVVETKVTGVVRPAACSDSHE